MKAITIYPENEEQLQAVKSILKILKVPFGQPSDSLQPHVLKSIERGLKQVEKEQTIDVVEFKKKHFLKK